MTIVELENIIFQLPSYFVAKNCAIFQLFSLALLLANGRGGEATITITTTHIPPITASGKKENSSACVSFVRCSYANISKWEITFYLFAILSSKFPTLITPTETAFTSYTRRIQRHNSRQWKNKETSTCMPSPLALLALGSDSGSGSVAVADAICIAIISCAWAYSIGMVRKLQTRMKNDLSWKMLFYRKSVLMLLYHCWMQ